MGGAYKKIKYGENRTKLTDEVHRERIQKIYEGNVIPLDNYLNTRTKIRYKCLIHNTEWLSRPNEMMHGISGCKQCRKISASNSLKDDLDSFKEKIYNKYGNEYEVLEDTYIDHNQKMTFMHYPKDGNKPHVVISKAGRMTTKNSGCPVCSGMQISKGYNDIATTNPKIASWFVNQKDTFIYSDFSNVKTDFKCPDCGFIIHKSINQVSRDGDLRCPRCKDGISYPNKFIFNILLQIEDKLQYLEREYRPNWCRFDYDGKNKYGIYDIYFRINNKQYIIEMDGGFHIRDRSIDGRTLEEIQYIDKEKDRLAIENGIEIIRIDCAYDFSNRYEYILKNILTSRLNEIIPLNVIDFNQANIQSQKSLMLEACNMWNDGYKVSEIIETLKIHKCVVSSYLKNGQKYGICKDYSSKNSYIRSRGRKVVCLNTKEIFNSLTEAEEFYNITDSITDCCKSIGHSAAKDKSTGERLFWMYYEDYEKMSEEDISNYIETKKKYLLENNIYGKSVICSTTNKIFESICEAGRYYNISECGIRNCCNKKQETSGQLSDGTRLKWMYYTDYLKLNKSNQEEVKIF